MSRAVTEVSHTYTRERTALADLQGDDRLASARMQFFLSRDLLKMHGPLAELDSVGALPTGQHWRILDLGTGLGSSSLGVARFAAMRGAVERLSVTALDSDPEALWLFTELARDLSALPGIPITLQTHEHDLRKRAMPAGVRGPFELIVIGLALNELSMTQTHEELLSGLLGYAALLSEDGCMIIVEPALRETSRSLHRLRDALAARAASPYVFAPCLHDAACPMLARERDYCHERVPCELPEALAKLAASAGLRVHDLTYSYLTLHRQRRSLRELAAQPEGTFRAVSGQLASKGKREVWLCGPSGSPRAMRLERHHSAENAAFEALERGCITSIAGAPAASAGGLLRIDAAARVELLQTWAKHDEHDEHDEKEPV